jgi:hypothetical protein
MTEEGRGLVPVSRGAVIRYLTDQGWRRQSSRDGRLTRLSLDADTSGEAVDLIFSTSAQEERSEVEAAINTIVQLYDTTATRVTQQLAHLAYDLIFSRIPDEYVRHESIELGMAQAYVQSMKGFLAASASTEISGQTSFRRTLKDGLVYANECRFGHTFHGSFGFVIESPVGLNDAPQMDVVEPSVPFGRKVVERIGRGFASFGDAVAQDDPSPIVTAVNGMSANMCDEVIGIIEDTGISKLELSISYSPEWGTLSSLPSGTYRIEQRYVDLLKDASSRLRKTEVPKSETVIGRIVRLETEGNPADLLNESSRDIFVSWDSAEYGHIRVQVGLDPKSYLVALEAHGSGQLFAVTGLLKRRGRGWLLEGASSPRLIA